MARFGRTTMGMADHRHSLAAGSPGAQLIQSAGPAHLCC